VLAAAALLAGGKQAAFFAAGASVEVVGLVLLARAHMGGRG
jgi:hypothetical protein